MPFPDHCLLVHFCYENVSSSSANRVVVSILRKQYALRTGNLPTGGLSRNIMATDRPDMTSAVSREKHKI